ncbi:hypothetical protein [Salisediminibacterium selenitireducens]|nr:hypothetical protein [Salisediminibacterium selenitireducens]
MKGTLTTDYGCFSVDNQGFVEGSANAGLGNQGLFEKDFDLASFQISRFSHCALSDLTADRNRLILKPGEVKAVTLSQINLLGEATELKLPDSSVTFESSAPNIVSVNPGGGLSVSPEVERNQEAEITVSYHNGGDEPVVTQIDVQVIIEEDHKDTDENAYGDLIDKYQSAIIERWDWSRLIENEMGYDQMQSDSLPDDYGFVLTDINRNGQDEMIIGQNFDNGRIFLAEIYALVNGEPERVYVGGLRRSAKIFNEAQILIHDSSGGFSYQTSMLFQLNTGSSMDFRRGYINVDGKDVYEIINPDDPYAEQSRGEELTSGQELEFFDDLGEYLDFTFSLFAEDQ